MELSTSRSRGFGVGIADAAPNTLLSPANIEKWPLPDISHSQFNTVDAIYTTSVEDEDEESVATYSGSEFTGLEGGRSESILQEGLGESVLED